MKKNVIIWLLFLSLLPALKLIAQEKPVTLHTATGDLHGMLTVPEKDHPVPVVLLIAGSGPTDMNGNQPAMSNNSLQMLSEAMLNQGLASLRFDKRGIASSQAAAPDERELRFEHYVADVREWIDWLGKDKRFSHIIVAGHSEGSLIGMMACAENSRTAAFVSIAGAGFPADEIMKTQLGSQPQPFKNLVFPLIDQLKQGETLTDVPPALYSLFRPSVQPYLISWFRYDPKLEIGKLRIPCLIIQGTTDIQVRVDDADRLASGNVKAVKIIIPNMNHVLKECAGLEQQEQLPYYTNPAFPLHTALVPEITSFIHKLN